ncbi:MAG TPA: hypothetical protein VFA21_07295 [Pyrinomonadaceae bacterium]|nr:hypothetical protein [Pyrinomonadaceae bacterium]
MPRPERLKTATALALLFAAAIACNLSAPPGGTQTFKSPDGKFQITAPGDWRALGQLKEGEAMKVGTDAGGGMAVVAFIKSKADLVDGITLDRYTEEGRKSQIADSNTLGATDSEPLTVGGRGARQYEVKRTQGGDKLTCLVTVIETAEDFQRITACAHPSKYDEYKATLKQISESFRAAR